MEDNLHSHGKWWNKTKQWIQKQYFNVAHTIDLNVNDEGQNFVNVFGHQFSTNQDARILYSSILWFTYRENLQFYCSDITSDVGWGCMLRVGQMVIAQALRRSQGVQNYGYPEKVKRIISLCDGKNSLFSIQAMTNKGMQIFYKGPGSWFTPAQAATIIKQIQNSDYSSELRVLVYNNQLEIASALQTLRGTNCNKKNEITQSYIKRNKQKIDHHSDISIFPGLIIILVRIGINYPQPQMLDSLIQLMKLPSFMGVLGGKTNLAHYIVGFTDKGFIYLDPHYVKEKTGEIQQYFGSSMFSMPRQKVDTSMGICFFIKDYGQFVRLADDLLMLKNKVFYSHSLLQQSSIVEISSCQKFQILDER